MSFLHDLRRAARMLGGNPGFTLVVVLTLGLGIGSSTAMFGLVRHALLREMPYHRSGELMVLSRTNPEAPSRRTVATPADYFDWRERSSSFQDVAAVSFANFNLSGIEAAERLQAGMATINFFPMLGVQPALGRHFLPEEAVSGGHFVVMISHGFWQRRFGGRADVIGESLTLNGRSHAIIGVLPPEFHFEHPVGLEGWASGWVDAELWRPMPFSAEDRANREGFWLLALARLKLGVHCAQARADLDVVSRQVRQEHPEYGWGIDLAPWRELVVGRSRPTLRILTAASAGVLLIACVNVAHLLLARATSRRHELGIRLALGAGGWRVARELLCEGALLSFLGGALGLAAAHMGLGLASRLGAAAFPRLKTVRLDPGDFGFAFLLCGLVTIVLVLVPSLVARRIDLAECLREGGRSATSGAGGRSLRSTLVVVEIASAIVLLNGAGLLVQSYLTLGRVDPGFKAGRIIALDVSMVDRRYVDPLKRVEFLQRVVAAARAVPGVTAAASVYGLPFGSMVGDAFDFRVEGEPAPEASRMPRGSFRMASSGYFDALAVPLKAGRDFNSLDRTNTPPVAIVNEAFARQFLSSVNPVGRRVRAAGASESWEIVGVVGNVKPDALDSASPPELYRPHSQACDWYSSIVVRASNGAAPLVPSLRAAANSVDRDCPVYNVRSLDSEVSSSLAPRRFALGVIWVFAATALGLAMAGVYGLMAYSVSLRTREFGIRLALGAGPAGLLRLVFLEGMRRVALGFLLGTCLSLWFSSFLRDQLFGVNPVDPLVYALVALVLLIVAALGCWLPARHGSRVDPTISLRSE